jgi:hypothetical protein
LAKKPGVKPSINEPLLPAKHELTQVILKQPSIPPHEVWILPIPREESNGCIVCFSAKKDTLFAPCGHLCVCN